MHVFVLAGTSTLAKEISVAKPTKILEDIISLPTISVHHIYGALSSSELICRIVSISINEKFRTITHGCTDVYADLSLSCVNLAHIQALPNVFPTPHE